MEIDDLINDLKDFLLSQYKDSVQGTQSYLAFEPLGHMISPDDFRFNGEFMEAKATDQLSIIADFVPQINSLVIPNGLNTVSGGYGNLLASVQFCGENITGSIDPYVSLFGKIKGDAQNLYQSQPSTIGGPDSTSYVCVGNPGEWYNPDSSVWQHKTFSTGSSTVVSTPSSTVKPVLWKLNPAAAKLQENLQFVRLLNSDTVVSKISSLQSTDSKIITAQPSAPGPVLIRHMEVATSVHPDFHHIPAATSDVQVHPIAPAGQDVASTQIKVPIAVNVLSDNAGLNKNAYRVINNGLSLNKMIAFNRTLGDNANTGTVNSSAFTMDFYYTLVSLQRPWFDQQLIDEAKIWFALAQKKGYYSTGMNDSSNTGILCAVPKAMIVIKNLNISAQWSAEDKNAATTAYGLGSFNITQSSFANNTLSAPGIQIIGWICEVLPALPLNDDENIS
jgi:hypothetical protein